MASSDNYDEHTPCRTLIKDAVLSEQLYLLQTRSARSYKWSKVHAVLYQEKIFVYAERNSKSTCRPVLQLADLSVQIGNPVRGKRFVFEVKLDAETDAHLHTTLMTLAAKTSKSQKKWLQSLRLATIGYTKSKSRLAEDEKFKQEIAAKAKNQSKNSSKSSSKGNSPTRKGSSPIRRSRSATMGDRPTSMGDSTPMLPPPRLSPSRTLSRMPSRRLQRLSSAIPPADIPAQSSTKQLRAYRTFLLEWKQTRIEKFDSDPGVQRSKLEKYSTREGYIAFLQGSIEEKFELVKHSLPAADTLVCESITLDDPGIMKTKARPSSAKLSPGTQAAQTAAAAAKLAHLREQREGLATRLHAAEDEYRAFAAKEYAGEEELVDYKIAEARAGPQTNKMLQAIHEAHTALLAKDAEIKAADEAERIHEIVDTGWKLVATRLPRHPRVPSSTARSTPLSYSKFFRSNQRVDQTSARGQALLRLQLLLQNCLPDGGPNQGGEEEGAETSHDSNPLLDGFIKLDCVVQHGDGRPHQHTVSKGSDSDAAEEAASSTHKVDPSLIKAMKARSALDADKRRKRNRLIDYIAIISSRAPPAMMDAASFKATMFYRYPQADHKDYHFDLNCALFTRPPRSVKIPVFGQRDESGELIIPPTFIAVLNRQADLPNVYLTSLSYRTYKASSAPDGNKTGDQYRRDRNQIRLKRRMFARALAYPQATARRLSAEHQLMEFMQAHPGLQQTVGTALIGFAVGVRARAEAGDRPSIVQSLVTISQWPYLGFQERLLRELYTQAASKSGRHPDNEMEEATHSLRVRIMKVMTDICRCPDILPNDRNPVSVSLDMSGVHGSKTVLPLLTLQDERLSSLVSVLDPMCFVCLLSCFSASTITFIIGKLLCNQSVVIVSDHAELLAPVCEALLACVWPYECSHVYIPYLPLCLFHLLFSPVNFLCGVSRENLQEWMFGEYRHSQNSVEAYLVWAGDDTVTRMPPPWSPLWTSLKYPVLTLADAFLSLGYAGEGVIKPSTPMAAKHDENDNPAPAMPTPIKRTMTSKLRDATPFTERSRRVVCNGLMKLAAKHGLLTACQCYAIDVEEPEHPQSPDPIRQLGDTTLAALRTGLIACMRGLLMGFNKQEMLQHLCGEETSTESAEKRDRFLAQRCSAEQRKFLQSFTTGQLWMTFVDTFLRDPDTTMDEMICDLFVDQLEFAYRNPFFRDPSLTDDLPRIISAEVTPMDVTVPLDARRQKLLLSPRLGRDLHLSPPSTFGVERRRAKSHTETVMKMQIHQASTWSAYSQSRSKGILDEDAGAVSEPINFPARSTAGSESLLKAIGEREWGRFNMARADYPINKQFVRSSRDELGMNDIAATLAADPESVDERDVDGLTPLLLACQCCDAVLVDLLLRFDVDVNGLSQQVDDVHNVPAHASPLMYAAASRDKRITEEDRLNTMELLLQNKADVTLKAGQLDNPLHHPSVFDLAACRCSCAVMELLLRHCAPMGLTRQLSKEVSQTDLQDAVLSLPPRPADMNEQMRKPERGAGRLKKRRATHTSYLPNSIEAIRSTSAANLPLWTPLRLAALHGKFRVVRLLLGHIHLSQSALSPVGADQDSGFLYPFADEDENNSQPYPLSEDMAGALQLACAFGHTEVVSKINHWMERKLTPGLDPVANAAIPSAPPSAPPLARHVSAPPRRVSAPPIARLASARGRGHARGLSGPVPSLDFSMAVSNPVPVNLSKHDYEFAALCAVVAGKIDPLKQLLASNIMRRNGSPRRMRHTRKLVMARGLALACALGSDEVVVALLQVNADVSVRVTPIDLSPWCPGSQLISPNRGLRPLYWAVAHGHAPVVDILLQAGAKMNVPSPAPSSIARSSPTNLRVMATKRTRAASPMGKALSRIRKTSSAEPGSRKMAPVPPPRLSLPQSNQQRFFSPNKTKQPPKTLGFSSLHLAVRGSHYSTVAVLLAHAQALGSSLVNDLSPELEFSALHLAVGLSDVRMTHALLRAKADPRIRPRSTRLTVLDMVASGAAWANASPDRQRTQATLINLIVHHGRQRGASDIVNQRLGSHGRTPLWLAAAGGHFAATVALLANNADPTITDRQENCTPAEIAAKHGHFLVDHLLNHHLLANLHRVSMHPETKECVVKFLDARDARAFAVVSSLHMYWACCPEVGESKPS